MSLESTIFTFDERLGIFFTIEGSSLSIAAVTSVLCFVIYKWLRRHIFTWGKKDRMNADATDSSLFLNLMFADLVQATGNIPSIVWMHDGALTEGPLCTAQAAVKQAGIVGVAMTSLAIAVHTFAVLVLQWRPPKHVSKVMVIGVWVFTALVIGIPNIIHRNQRYYGNTGFWCWIVEQYKVEQIVTEYLWVWIAGFSMVILYGIMFVVMRGWFIIDNGIYWHKNYNPSLEDIAELESDDDKALKVIANMMLFYPALYIFCVLPNSISRWLFFNGFNIPYQFTLFASTIFALSGMLNVILFFSTRPELVVGPKVVVAIEDDDHKTSWQKDSPYLENSTSFNKNLSVHNDIGTSTYSFGKKDVENLDVQPEFDPAVLFDLNQRPKPIQNLRSSPVPFSDYDHVGSLPSHYRNDSAHLSSERKTLLHARQSSTASTEGIQSRYGQNVY